MCKVVERSLEPVWKETWEVVVKMGNLDEETLDLEMRDKDSFKADEFMGRASVPLSNLIDKSDQWVRIRKWTSRSTSYVFIRKGVCNGSGFREVANPVSLDHSRTQAVLQVWNQVNFETKPSPSL